MQKPLLIICVIFLLLAGAGCRTVEPIPPGDAEKNEKRDKQQPGAPVLPSDLTGLDFPTDLAFDDSGTLFFTEKGGALRIVEKGRLRSEPLAVFKVPRLSGYHETGLLGLALSPKFAKDRQLYLYHTYTAGAGLRNRVVRIDARRPKRREVIFDGIRGERIHVGGKLAFGPDGKLYISTGESDRPNLSQDTDSPNGKVLRVNRDGSIPPDNPFKGSPVYAYGLRNVFGMAFAPDGRLFVTDNGPQANDEINEIKRGANYGWPVVTGRETRKVTPPLITFEDSIAPTGIVYYDKDRFADLRGSLIFGDWNDSRVHALSLEDGRRRDRIIAELSGGVTAVAVGPDGALYVATASSIERIGRLP